MTRRAAILLLGPTGSGKTPLGQELESRGYGGRRCVHFDFGQQLRAVAESPQRFPRLTADDVQVVLDLLRTGALLENAQFHIARAILLDFVDQQHFGDDDLLILNGLPRHLGQATDVDGLASIETVVAIECSAAVVRQRITANTGGDRAGRVDDDREAVERKLELYHQRTRPLIEHYRLSGAHAAAIHVDWNTTALGMWCSLNRE